jgi:hypothetical protein
VGEALVSTLDEKGAPNIVARTAIRPPDSRLGPATDTERAAVMAASPVRGLYETVVDRDSASEILAARRGEADQATAEAKLAEARAKADALAAKDAEKAAAAREKEQARHEREAARARAPARRSSRETPIEAVTKSVLRTAGSTITRELLRGLLGGLRRR